ncbi:MAG: acylphosphatase [Candidatus Acetothermia bacterium]|jgi:acylphosphatase|nr:acylphosphatase [Candidatus Acetothermia bacterium]
MNKRVHLFIAGRVQGVFFRAHARDLAQRLGLVGFARNLPDGRVEVVAEGDEEKLQELVRFCHRGPPLAEVTGVDVRWEEPTGELRGFVVR